MALHSLRTKILISLSLTTILFGLGMVFFAETVIYHKLHDKLGEKGHAITQRLAADCINPIITERYFEITMLFKDLVASEPDVVYAYALNETGREVAYTFDKGVPKELKRAHPADMLQPFSVKDLLTDKGMVEDIAVPLMQGQVGVLHVGFSHDAISRDVNEIVAAIVVFALTVLLVGALASFGFARAITKPLLDLARAAESFGRGGEIDHSLLVDSDDEIGELSRIFKTMIERRRQTREERERLILELKEAMGKVKTLSGMLPICASCKKIRDDKGYWKQIESYIGDHSDAQFSHGICPDCVKKLYPDVWEKIQNDPEIHW